MRCEPHPAPLSILMWVKRPRRSIMRVWTTLRPRVKRHPPRSAAPATGQILGSYDINPDHNYWVNKTKKPGQWPNSLSTMSRLITRTPGGTRTESPRGDSDSRRDPKGSRTACPRRDSNPHCDDFKSSASADWATGARRYPPSLKAPLKTTWTLRQVSGARQTLQTLQTG